jgi:rubrerythrin
MNDIENLIKTIEDEITYFKDKADRFKNKEILHIYKREIEENEVILQALKKQIPKKVEKIIHDDEEYCETCPICGKFAFDNYCPECGQRLEW